MHKVICISLYLYLPMLTIFMSDEFYCSVPGVLLVDAQGQRAPVQDTRTNLCYNITGVESIYTVALRNTRSPK